MLNNAFIKSAAECLLLSMCHSLIREEMFLDLITCSVIFSQSDRDETDTTLQLFQPLRESVPGHLFEAIIRGNMPLVCDKDY